ncbi:hypothetical protein NXX95_22320 [Bacteroides xylanisolvens]|uniref:hypothetical protein n=1 Tax=Bacteroides xylanisolvens TaxID=371601 RepID=UPI0021631F9A|nr:hypothetical protein [Bacteroides xylanisolvens]UVP23702.1 hypothetical protein NXX95_22320 [Bacteroides xylanisolvens]
MNATNAHVPLFIWMPVCAPRFPLRPERGGGRYTSFIYANGVSVLLLIYGMGSAKAPIDG